MYAPASGQILFNGDDIAGKPSHSVCNLGIGQVAEGRQVFPTLSVRENLLVGSMLPRAKNRRAINLERVFTLFPAWPTEAHRPQVLFQEASSRC